jgi:N-dimethylarginine dimethylaminohydrolase
MNKRSEKPDSENKSTTLLEEFWRSKQKRKWGLSDIPFYSPNRPPNISAWHDLDYLEIYDKVYGNNWGANGIGKLREVALVRISEYENCPLYLEDPAYFKGFEGEIIDTDKWRDEQESYARILEENGVQVHWIDFNPSPPMSAFGPMTNLYAAAELLVVRGGSIIPKMGWGPLSVGRAEYLARWAFWYLNIPPLLTISGKGVCEAGASFFIAEDAFVTANSVAYNDEGLAQLEGILRRTGTKGILVMKMPGFTYFDPDTGCSAHPDMILGPLDIGKAIVFPTGCDYYTHMWLRKKKFELVEANLREQVNYLPCNLITLEPGKVIMHAGAREAINSVRKLGVDVIEVPYTQGVKHGGGVSCATMRLKRDKGPGLEEISG